MPPVACAKCGGWHRFNTACPPIEPCKTCGLEVCTCFDAAPAPVSYADHERGPVLPPPPGDPRAELVSTLGALEDDACAVLLLHMTGKLVAFDAARSTLLDDARSMTDARIDHLLYRARRVLAGQRQYGRLDLKNDPRDWVDQERQERADGDFYRSAQALSVAMGWR